MDRNCHHADTEASYRNYFELLQAKIQKYDIDAQDTSPSGWTNNDLGLAWVEQVFDQLTTGKARTQVIASSFLIAMAAILPKIFLISVTTTRSLLQSFLPVQLTHCSHSMWSCLHHLHNTIQPDSLNTFMLAKDYYMSKRGTLQTCFGLPTKPPSRAQTF
jgi:hypothetical protein